MDLFEQEIIDILSSFNKHNVRYILVGGFAVNFYGYNRATADLDLWIELTDNNKSKLIDSLDELSYDTSEIASIQLENQPPIDIPVAGFRIELINYLTNEIQFNEAYDFASILDFGGIQIKVLSIDHLIQIKESSNRPKDLLDAEELRKIMDRKENN